MEMPNNVFNHDDGVIHENADAEDQCEEGDAVQRETVEIKDEQRERQRGWNRNGNDAALTPAEREPDQNCHTEDGDAHVQQQLIGFFRRSLAVVARHTHGDISGNDRPFEQVHLAQHIISHGDGICTRALRNAERHCGFFRDLRTVEHVLHRFLACIVDPGDFTQIHRTAAEGAYDHVANVFRRFEKRPGFNKDLLVACG